MALLVITRGVDHPAVEDRGPDEVFVGHDHRSEVQLEQTQEGSCIFDRRPADALAELAPEPVRELAEISIGKVRPAEWGRIASEPVETLSRPRASLGKRGSAILAIELRCNGKTPSGEEEGASSLVFDVVLAI